MKAVILYTLEEFLVRWPSGVFTYLNCWDFQPVTVTVYRRFERCGNLYADIGGWAADVGVECWCTTDHPPAVMASVMSCLMDIEAFMQGDGQMLKAA